MQYVLSIGNELLSVYRTPSGPKVVVILRFYCSSGFIRLGQELCLDINVQTNQHNGWKIASVGPISTPVMITARPHEQLRSFVRTNLACPKKKTLLSGQMLKGGEPLP